MFSSEESNFTPAEIEAYYRSRIPSLVVSKAKEWRTACPVHQGERDSLAIDSQTGQFYCHSECRSGGNVFAFEAKMQGLNVKEYFPQIKASVYRIIGRETQTVWQKVGASQRYLIRYTTTSTKMATYYFKRSNIATLKISASADRMERIVGFTTLTVCAGSCTT
jgi:DNA primase